MLIPALLSLATMATSSAPQSHLAISPCEAGEHYQFETVECPFELRNTGDTPIHVSNGKARFPWDTIDSNTITVPPKGVAYVKATADLRESEGRTVRVFRFDTDEAGNTRRGSEIRAFVLSVLDQSKPTLDFGTVKLEETMPERSVSLSSREVKDFRITAIESKPDWIDVTLGKDGRSISARLKPNVPWGLIHHDYFVKLKINAPQQSYAWVAIEAQTLGDVAPDGNPFQLGLIRTGDKHEFLVRVTSRSGKDFKVGNLEVKQVKATAKAEECSPSAKGCRLIRVKLADDIQPGKVEGLLEIELPDLHRTLPIELIGMLVSADTKIHDMSELMSQPTEGAQSQSATPSKSVDLTKAITSSVRKADPPPPGTGPLLKWSAAHQQTIYGYVIYRGDEATGPFLRVNKAVIPVVGEGADNSGSYQWRDDSAVSGKTYWYSIGVINRNGSRQDLTGAQKVTAK